MKRAEKTVGWLVFCAWERVLCLCLSFSFLSNEHAASESSSVRVSIFLFVGLICVFFLLRRRSNRLVCDFCRCTKTSLSYLAWRKTCAATKNTLFAQWKLMSRFVANEWMSLVRLLENRLWALCLRWIKIWMIRLVKKFIFNIPIRRK